MSTLLRQLEIGVECAQKSVDMYERMTGYQRGARLNLTLIHLRKAKKDLRSAHSKLRNYNEHGAVWPAEVPK